ncbi:MAG TPA: hypothetical protein VFC30_00505 [Solirubrobacteraceae bacterium]|nr:hypothetical protein [Solirubrobacteraceae bacterium]
MSKATVEEHAFGLSWVMDEPMTRTSHALLDGGRVWLIDPVDEPEAMARVRELGEPQAVLQLLDRHNRDCESVAGRLGVPHLRIPREVPDSPFLPTTLMQRKRWREVALWWPERSALVVAEAVGTAPLFAVGPGPVGVHPVLRLTPPRELRAFHPEHLLVGHGPSVSGPGTSAELEQALARSRRDIPRVLLKLPSLRPR